MPEVLFRTIDLALDSVLRAVSNTNVQALLSACTVETDADDALGTKLPVLCVTAKVIKTRLDALIADESRERNSHLPIHHLPPEILTLIFSYALADCALEVYYEQLRQLAEVSYLWKDVIVGTPAFWTIVSGRHPRHVRRSALTHSANAPLTIDGVIGPDPALEDIEADVCPAIGRWSSATLDFHPYGAGDQLNRAAPKLKRLDLHLSDPTWTEPLKLFRDKANQLQDLTLREASIQWDSNLLSGLQSLRLSKITRHPPTMQDIMSILARCPNIRSLSLERLSTTTTTTFAPPAVLHLPHLKTLRLLHLDIDVIQTIISSIRIPNCSTFAVWCEKAHVPAAACFNASTTHISELLQRLVRTSPQLTLEVLPESFFFSSALTTHNHQTDPYNAEGVTVCLEGEIAKMDSLPHLMALLPPAITCPLSIKLYPWSEDVSVEELLDSFSSTTSLELAPGQAPEFQKRVVAYLSRLGETASRLRPLANLQHLKLYASGISTTEDMRHLLALVEERCKAPTSHSDTEPVRPSRLQSLSYCVRIDLSEDAVPISHQIRKVVGRGRVNIHYVQ